MIRQGTAEAAAGESAGDAFPRRRLLTAGAVAAAAASMRPSTVDAAPPRGDGAQALMRDVEHYAALGNKRSGGAGELAVGAWLEGELRALGFDCERHAIDAPWFEPEQAELVVGAQRLPAYPVGIPVQTDRAGIAAPLAVVGAPATPDALARVAGAIALAFLPYGRWSSALTPAVGDLVAACQRAGARAVALATTGPTGKAIMLNADGNRPMFDLPVVTVAPEAAAAMLAQAGAAPTARMTLHGPAGRRPTYNLLARRGRPNARQLIVSTPRSGWFACGAERGPGIAIWLDLARQIARDDSIDATFLCTSGHEYENMGAEHVIDRALPPPDQTDLWLHLGAGFAARDWHEFGTRLVPLPGADSQRFLSVSDPQLPRARALFRGQPGLEAPYSTAKLMGGELKVIAARGYANIAGLFAAHRLHHVEDDDAGCVSPEALADVARSLRELIRPHN